MAVTELIAALRCAEEVLDNVRGNINPERGYCAELEADVEAALVRVRAALADGVDLPDGAKNG